ncbi:ATP-binding protein [archaeon]|nr:ATP-binding protein [archaeon]
MPGLVVGRDDDDLKKFGDTGAILLGKHVVGTGEESHLTTPLMMDVLRPHLIIVTGKRGTGKSFLFGIVNEEMKQLPKNIRDHLCSIIIDTQGIFWTMKMPNEKEAVMLNEWGMKPKGFDVSVYVPEGQARIFSSFGVDYDGVFSILPSQLTVYDWMSVFEIKQNDSIGLLLQRVYKKLQGRNFRISEIISAIKKEEEFGTEKIALQNMFESAEDWGIFGDEKVPDLLMPGKTSILDVSLTPQNVRALLVGLTCKKILTDRIKARREEEQAEMEIAPAKRVPMPWIFIDEAHNFLPENGKTAASDILFTLVKEGRQPGVSLVFATQQPNKLSPDALTQADIVISHSLTAKSDIEALGAIMQTYMLFEIGKYINELPKVKGAALVLDDNSERIYKIRVRPRQSWHAGSSPIAL